MNYIFFGKESDLNIGNGKTISAVRQITIKYLTQNKKIFSNIKLHIPYTPVTPHNLFKVLNTENSVVLFDEIHAIIHKNHRISESCTKHQMKGLCYHLSEFFRQVRKRNIDTYSTAQVFSDVPYQYRVLMQESILCEKFYKNKINNNLLKCDKDYCDHKSHYIFNYNVRNRHEEYFNSEPFHDLYDSSEIVSGWI